MSNKDDALKRDELDAVSADLLLKRLREGLEQRPSAKDNEAESPAVGSTQISEETMQLARSEVIHGQTDEYDADELDEARLRKIMDLPPREENSIDDMQVHDDEEFLKSDTVETDATLENSSNMSEPADDVHTDADDDPWYDSEEEAFAQPKIHSQVDDNVTELALDTNEQENTEDEIEEGFLVQVAKMVGDDDQKRDELLADDNADDFDFVDDELVINDTATMLDGELPPRSEDGGREYGGLDGNDMNTTERILASLFGDKDDLVKNYGKEVADEMLKSSDELAASHAPKKKKPYEFFDADSEYTSSSQNDEIKAKYTAAFRGAVVRFLLCFVFAGVLFVFENAGMLGIKLPSVLDSSVYPTVCAMIDLQLVLLCALMSVDKLMIGYVSLFKLKPTWEAIPAVSLTASIVYTALLTILHGARGAVLYNFPVALCFVCTLLYEIMQLKREVMSFDVVSAGNKKSTIRQLSDEERARDAKLFEEYVPAGSPMFAVTRTGFVDGYIRRTRARRTDKQLPAILLLTVAEVLLAIGFGIFMEMGTYETITMAYLAVILGAQGTLMLAASLPMYRASRAAYESESAIVGENAPEEYSDGSVVFFEDKDIFPATGVKINSVKVYGENRIDGVIYYAASIFSHIGGPLSDVFALATIEIGQSEEVELLESSENGLHCMVDRKSLYLGSNDYMKSLDFETPYAESDEAAEKNSGIRLMFIADEQEILAKFYVQYSADLEYELIFKQLYKAGMCVGIRTRDPNINEEFIARKLRLKRDYPLKVVHCAIGAEYIRRSERADSGIVSASSVKALLRTLSMCDRIKYVSKIQSIFEIVGAILAIFSIYAVATFGMLGLGSAYAALYQLFWLVPTVLVAMLTD